MRRLRGRLLNHLEEEGEILLLNRPPCCIHAQLTLTVMVSSPGQEYHVLTPKTVPRGSGPVSCPHCRPARTEDPGRGWYLKKRPRLRGCSFLPLALGVQLGQTWATLSCARVKIQTRERFFSGLFSPPRESCPHIYSSRCFA